MKEWRVSLRTRINRDANGAQIRYERCALARAGGNRALPSTRLTFPMIVIGSTAKSEGINYPCGFPIPPPLPRLSERDSTKTNRDVSRAYKPGKNGALFLAEEIRSNFNILFKKEKRVTMVASAFPRALPRRSILQHPRKLRYEFPTVTRNVNVRYARISMRISSRKVSRTFLHKVP